MGVRPARPGPLHLVRNRGRPPAPAPGPQVFPGHSASAAVGDPLGSVVLGKSRGGPLCGREGFQLPGHQPRDPRESGLVSQGWGTLPLGRLVVGRPALRLPVPMSWPPVLGFYTENILYRLPKL